MKSFLAPVIVTAVLLVGCVGIPTRPDATEYKRTITHAISQSEKTELGNALKDPVKQHPGQSGFRIFENGSQSLTARLALVRLAQKTVDLQYYAIANDVTSNLMMEALIRAAHRGVRVRLLIDSFTVNDMEDALLALNGVENIEIRVFNPLTTQDQSYLSRLGSLFTELPQANKRMHNKALISDNQMAIMGGRNLSDEYFDADDEFEFKDMDVLTAGPITNEMSKSFDEYWNDQNAFPVDAVYKPNKDPKAIEQLRSDLKQNWDEQTKDPKRRQQLVSPLPEIMKDPALKLVWAKSELASDDPDKIERPTSIHHSEPLKYLVSLLDTAKHEFIIISAYFVPKDEGVEWLGSLEQKGIHVRILTNSLASTDVVAVHSGYAPYREALLRKGIELYELIPIGEKRSRQRLLGRKQPPRAGLHSKVYVIDGRHTIIGSFNLDPRSVELNTEMAIVIHSEELSQQVQKMFARAIQPNVSYHLMFDQSGKELRWQGIEKGKKLRYSHDPHSGVWRNIQNFVVTILPVEDQL